MNPATPKTWTLHAKLSALAERGTDGERESAKTKLAKLCQRYDFTAAPEPAGDIFAGFTFPPCNLGEVHPLIEIPDNDGDIASAIKWAFESRLGLSGSFRYAAAALEIRIASPASAMPALRSLAQSIGKSFAKLWAEFAKTPGIEANVKRQFIAGLADGMLDDERKGQPLPPPITKRKPVRKAKGKAITHPIGIAIHPYAVAVELGRKVRVAAPLGSIVEELQNTVAALQEVAA